MNIIATTLDMFKNKKNTKGLIIAFCVGIAFIMLGGGLFAEKKPPTADGTSNYNSEQTEERLQQRLQAILSQINGVGSVSVMITLEGSEQKTLANDVKLTKNTAGSLGEGTQQAGEENKTVILNASDGSKPLIIKTSGPPVQGVVIVAQGAENEAVKEDILKAVRAALPVLPHKVEVFAKKK